MAKEATNPRNLPDFSEMAVPERSEWLLAQLRKLPGTVVVDDGDRLFQLETTGSLVSLLAELALGLTEEQLKVSLRWLHDQELRRSKNKGGGKYTHFIKLEPENGDSLGVAPADDAGGKIASDTAPAEVGAEDSLAAAVAVLERAATQIGDLRKRLAAAEQAVASLNEENTRLAEENGRLTVQNATLSARLAFVAPFHDGLQKLQETLGD